MSVGWVCPKCGRVWAPWVSTCNCGNIPRPVPVVPTMPHPSSPGTTTSIPEDNNLVGAGVGHG
jgi:hypothetical protein